MLTREVQGVVVPAFLYGTAWKEAETGPLVRRALAAGFRGIDTANQRRHYAEAAVGDAVAAAIDAGEVSREGLFLQTKFTFAGGQDHRIPYDPAAPPREQVRASFESSLEHLHTDHVDSYVLHGPSSRHGLSPTDWAAWRAMEGLHAERRARVLGVSNVSLSQLSALQKEATVKPAFVQNRCFAETGWDRDVRAFCTANGILYQGFSLLTANDRALRTASFTSIAERHHRTPAQVVFRFALQVGMVPLTGTTSQAHMVEDLAVSDFELSPAEVARIEAVAE